MGGAVAALATGLVADRLLVSAEDARLIAAARVFAFELTQSGAVASEIVIREVAEQAAAGIRVALFQRGQFQGGDPALTAVHDHECRSHHSLRVCGIGVRPGQTAVAATRIRQGESRWPFVVAGVLAVALVSGVGQLISRRIARRVMDPLAQLQQEVADLNLRSIQPAVSLLPRDAILEVETLRGAIRTLAYRLISEAERSRRFAGNAAHELRTPLTAILGELELLAERIGNKRAYGAELQRIHTKATHLAQLVEHLLLLATPGESLALSQPLSVPALLSTTRAAMSTSAQAQIYVETLHPGSHGVPWVRGDRPLLQALLLNVLENAVAYAPGRPIQMRCFAVDATVIIQVDDDGEGIPAQDRAKVFEAFYRGTSSTVRSRRGHGIGLALVAHVAEIHGGQVAFVDGAPGARLELRLPRIDSNAL